MPSLSQFLSGSLAQARQDLPPGPVGTAEPRLPYVEQTMGSTGTPGGNIIRTTTFSKPTTPGTMLLAFVQTNQTGAGNSVTDDAGNVWSQSSLTILPASRQSTLWICMPTDHVAPANTIQWTGNNARAVSINLLEIGEAASIGEGDTVNDTTLSTAHDMVSLSVAQPALVVVGAGYVSAGSSTLLTQASIDDGWQAAGFGSTTSSINVSSFIKRVYVPSTVKPNAVTSSSTFMGTTGVAIRSGR